MSSLRYGNVTLKICHVYSWDVRSVYDESGTDLLWYAVRIDLGFVFNPYATASDTTQLAGSQAPAGQRGDLGAVSFAKLHALLMMPRQKLTYRVGDNIVLEAPLVVTDGNGREFTPPCDSHNGPKPISLTAVRIEGSKTLLCRYVVECYLGGCGSPPSALISHRWEVNQEWDRSFYETRTLTGTAVFRSDLLQADSLNPDDFRAVFASHPIPPGFHRVRGNFTLGRDNTEIRYTIVDEEQTYPLNPRKGIVKIEATFDNNTNYATAQAIEAAIAGTIDDAVHGRFGSAARNGVGALMNTFPDRIQVWRVAVWGRKDVTRRKLVNALVEVLHAFLNNPKNYAGFSYSNVHVDIMKPTFRDSLQGILSNYLRTVSTNADPRSINALPTP